jgi:transcriptional regulator with XRE-family HTH domain
MDTLVKRLKWAREAAGLSQRALSALSGLASSHVQLIESERAVGINITTAQALGSVLGVSLDWLMGGVGELPAVESIAAAIERAHATSTLRDEADETSTEIVRPSQVA